MRVFYDTNVLLSVTLWTGEAHRVHVQLVENGFTPVISERLLAEALEVVARKFPAVDQAELESVVRAGWSVVPSPRSTASIALRDPSDDFVLADAEAALADLLLTGDHDLLEAAGRIDTLEVISLSSIRSRLKTS